MSVGFRVYSHVAARSVHSSPEFARKRRGNCPFLDSANENVLKIFKYIVFVVYAIYEIGVLDDHIFHAIDIAAQELNLTLRLWLQL